MRIVGQHRADADEDEVVQFPQPDVAARSTPFPSVSLLPWNAPVGQDHALLAAEADLGPSWPCDLAVEGLGVGEGDERTTGRGGWRSKEF